MVAKRMMNDQRARMAKGNSSRRERPSEIARIPKPMVCEFAEAFSFVNGNGARNSLHVGMPRGESSIFDDDFLVRLDTCVCKCASALQARCGPSGARAEWARVSSSQTSGIMSPETTPAYRLEHLREDRDV
jgi:hypothetical protein